MTKILFYAVNNIENVVLWLKKNTNFDLRVISNAENLSDFAPDVVITEQYPGPLATSKVIRIFTDYTDDTDTLCQTDEMILAPVLPQELHMRILRLISPQKRIFSHNGLKIDFHSATVELNGSSIHLTLFEYKLLALLAENHKNLVTYDQIMHSLWNTPLGNEMLSIRVFVNAIRKKFAAAGAIQDYISTYAGKGYKLL